MNIAKHATIRFSQRGIRNIDVFVCFIFGKRKDDKIYFGKKECQKALNICLSHKQNHVSFIYDKFPEKQYPLNEIVKYLKQFKTKSQIIFVISEDTIITGYKNKKRRIA